MMGLRQAEVPRNGLKQDRQECRDNMNEARKQLVERLLQEPDVDQWVLVSDLFKERSRDYSAIARASRMTFEYRSACDVGKSTFRMWIRLHQHLRRMHGEGK
jgi:urease accessory protein UreF